MEKGREIVGWRDKRSRTEVRLVRISAENVGSVERVLRVSRVFGSEAQETRSLMS